MNENKLHSDAYRGSRAKALLDDELLSEAFKAVHAGLIETWTECDKPEERERIWVAVGLLDKIKSALIVAVADGKVAQHQLDAMAARGVRAA